jgi:hypothetical protein
VIVVGGWNVPARHHVEVADCRDAVKPIFKGRESRRLWKEHEKAVEAFVQIRVSLRLEELHAEIYAS